jgi:hypothetical protein
MAESIHDFHDDPRNAGIQIWINGELRPRAAATVSVFDSGFVLGDGVWEGLRVAGGHPLFLDEHLDRLQATASGRRTGTRRSSVRPASRPGVRARPTSAANSWRWWKTAGQSTSACLDTGCWFPETQSPNEPALQPAHAPL